MLYDATLFVLDHLRLFFGGTFIAIGSIIFFLILKAPKKSKTLPISSDIRYADPSHNSKTWKKLSKATEKPALVRSKVTEYKNIKYVNLDKIEIKNKILHFLSSVEKSGAGHKRIKAYGWGCVRGDLPQAKIPKEYNDLFKGVFDNLKQNKIVRYNKKEKIWHLNKTQNKNQKIELVPLTDKEIGYFKYKKLGAGWSRLPKKTNGLDAVWWIYQNFNPEEFEQFCCAILAHHGVKDAHLSKKRASGADGGIDGLGTYIIDGNEVGVAIQAKCYRPDRQVTSDEADKFVGSLTKKNVDYGFLITTAVFSETSVRETKEVTNNTRNKINIQLLDQNDLINCLIYKANSPHGYGLHKTDKGFYYLNPEMLRREIDKY